MLTLSESFKLSEKQNSGQETEHSEKEILKEEGENNECCELFKISQEITADITINKKSVSKEESLIKFENELNDQYFCGIAYIEYINGSTFEGNLHFGKAHGKGIYEENGVKYLGNFIKNKRHGSGQEITENFHFKGTYYNDEKSAGTMLYKNMRYDGYFKNGVFDGTGRLQSKEGFYIGEFKSGFKEGLGSFHWKEGHYYEGSYHHNLKNGFGTLRNENGEILYEGIWVNDYPCPVKE